LQKWGQVFHLHNNRDRRWDPQVENLRPLCRAYGHVPDEWVQVFNLHNNRDRR
jgi:hypothetical protein